jgi:hypothetical protein
VPAGGAEPDPVLAGAERAFSEGVEARTDADRARPAFARAAAGYDELWAQGHRTPDLALARGRAHRLAGALGRSIAALHDGLAAARFSRPLQVELDDARARVLFPTEGELAKQGRPRQARAVSSRMSPADAWLIAGSLWLTACAAVARFAMSRNALWLLFSAACVPALGALAVSWLQDARQRERDEALPLLVLTRDAHVRKGNAAEYPASIEPPLPAGAEVRELSRRGGWVQVQLPGGLVGWVPEPATVACGSLRPQHNGARSAGAE